MAKMVKVSLAKALKMKKRLVESIAKVSREIVTSNVVSGQRIFNENGTVRQEPDLKRDVDVLKLLELRKNLKNSLVFLKSALNEANVPQYHKILQMAEIKDDISFFRGLPTQDRESLTAYDTKDVTTVYSAAMKKDEVEKLVVKLQKELDTLQEEVEAFNWTTTIEVEDLPE